MGETIKPAKLFGHRYPWDDWFARDRVVLLRGRDFDCEPSSMAVLVRITMAKRDLERTVRVRGDEVIVEPKTDRRGARKRRRAVGA